MHKTILNVPVDICRLCGGKQSGNINIFGIEGKKRSLESIIKRNVNIYITLNDPLSKTVCKTCCNQLETFVKFQAICRTTQDKLMNDFLAVVETSTADNQGKECTSSRLSLVEENASARSGTTGLAELATEIEIYTDGTKQISNVSRPTILQPRSDLITLSPSDEYNESRELVEQNEEVLVFENGDCSSDSQQQLNYKSLPMNTPTYIVIKNEDGPTILVPINELHPPFSNFKPPSNKVPIPRLTKENRCDPLTYTIQSESSNNVEVSVEKNNVTSKPKRKKRIPPIKKCRVPASKRVRKLVKKVSNTEFCCILCGLTFPHNYLCEYHVRTHTGEMPFKCEDCDKSFPAMFMLKKHNLSHDTGTRYLCKTCGRSFRSMGTLNCHEKIHLDTPAPFVCDTCNKPFYFRTSYQGHLVTHQTRRDHMCDQCPKTYKTMRHLKEHVARIHDGILRHACPICDKRFYRNTTFKQHLRLHTTERPYPCQICGRAFNEQTNWRRHQQVHQTRGVCNYLEVEVETVILSD